MHILLAIALILPPAVVVAETCGHGCGTDDLVRAMDAMFVTMTTPGRRGCGLERKGSIRWHNCAERGGLDRTILANDAPGDRWVRYLGGSRLAVPDSFAEVLTLPRAPMQGEIGFQDMSQIKDGIWLCTSGRLQRRGNALCSKGWESMALLAQRGAALSGFAGWRTLPAIDVEATPARLRPFTDVAAIIKP